MLSCSEASALVFKAARGAGLDWGLAEEAGWAADWLARRGLPAIDWAARWLGPATEGQVTPVQIGAALSDAAGREDLLPLALEDGLVAPGYLLPFLHRLSTDRGTVAMMTGVGLGASVDPQGNVAFGPGWSDITAGWTIIILNHNVGASDRPPRPQVPLHLLECLDGLALRTTVPPSAGSRGQAGAASTDND